MKKILLMALAAAAMVGCSQNEEIDNAAQKAEVNFKTVVGISTKAVVMNTTDFKTFLVNAYNTGSENMGAVSLDASFMSNVTATKTGETWGIDKGPFYWPVSDKIQFFAYSPISAVTKYTATTGYPSFDYTVKVADSQEDLLAAKAENQTKALNSTGGVTLTFQHILTQINFSAEFVDANATYSVSKIEIVGVKSQGTFSYIAGNDKVGSWVEGSDTDNYEYAADYNATAVNKIVDFSTDSNALMLLPQTLPATAKIQVTYEASVGGTTTFDGIKEVAITGTWGVGQKIRYTLKLASDAAEVKLVPSVGNWDDPETATPVTPLKP